MDRRRWIAIVFYGGLAVLLAGVLLKIWGDVLPASMAERINHNSEGYLLALVLGSWIEFVRPRLAGATREWPVVAGAAAICAGIALVLLNTHLDSRFRTLNETFLAAALLIPYVQLRRPIPPRVAAALSVGFLAVAVLGNRTALVTELAETLAALMVAPAAFDLVDRGILDPHARTSPALRYAWYATMVVVPVGFHVLEYSLDLSGTTEEVARFGVRVAEVFICMLALELYFAVGLGRTGTGKRLDRRGTRAGRRPHPLTSAVRPADEAG